MLNMNVGRGFSLAPVHRRCLGELTLRFNTESEVLSRDNCQPFYEANPSVAVAASSAIASATAAARSALATRNPQVLTDYPLCAVSTSIYFLPGLIPHYFMPLIKLILTATLRHAVPNTMHG